MRALHPEAREGWIDVAIDDPLRIEDFLGRTNVPTDQARMLMLNHRRADLDTVVQPGDRLAVFPPALAFNMYVALSFAHKKSGQDGANPLPEAVTNGDQNPGE